MSGDLLTGKWEAPGKEDSLDESGFHPAGMSAMHQGQEKEKQREVNLGQWHVWSQWAERGELELLDQWEQIRERVLGMVLQAAVGKDALSAVVLGFFFPFFSFFFHGVFVCVCACVCVHV